MSFRKLTAEEVETLQSQGCSAGNWSDLNVKNGFRPDHVRNVQFAGQIKLGVFAGAIEVLPGVAKACGLYNSSLVNAEIGDCGYISNVTHLANYNVGDHVVIENVPELIVTGETSFGNGREIKVWNEGGGRELPIFEKLSASIAYLLVAYRHDSVMVEKLARLIAEYARGKTSTRGRIGDHARIVNCTKIRNVAVGSHAVVEGASLLEEGTLASCAEAPVFIGEDVVAKRFMVLSGSRVDGAAMLSDTFVGQAVQIGKQFSAEHSAFFANCEGFHGEAAGLFAGPYTVTHHKLTLLIAGMFSFYNAGSGTNQSNHMYKLGPLHQGLLERGAKTGSFSYLLWPSRVGAFTAVVGKHNANFDTSDFPFSYITERDGTSVLSPAINLFTVGTKRDSEKWPKRDRRKDPHRLDFITFDLFSPYTIQKVVNGMRVLQDLHESADKEQIHVAYKGIKIRRPLLRTCRKYYQLAIDIFIGNQVLRRMDGLTPDASLSKLRNKLMAKPGTAGEKWIDLAGLLAPQSDIENIVRALGDGETDSIESLQAALKLVHDSYDEKAWQWTTGLLLQQLGIDMAEISARQLSQIISTWQNSYIKLNNMVLKDAEKEFAEKSQIGFGIDGDETVRAADFLAVRGAYEKNEFVRKVRAESAEITRTAEQWLAGLTESA